MTTDLFRSLDFVFRLAEAYSRVCAVGWKTRGFRHRLLAVVAINGWNRLNIAFRTEAGNYKPAPKSQTARPR